MPENVLPATLDEQLAERRSAAAATSTPERTQATDDLFRRLEHEVLANAVAVGEQAPDFTLLRADDDRPVHLAEELRHGPVVLSFYRGQWCPYCNLELRAVQQRSAEISALGAQVFFVGPETRADAQSFLEKTEATIPVLYDLDGTVMAAYRIEFTQPEALRRTGAEPWNPRTGWRLPVPATFVLDGDGVVRARFINGDYRYRMEPSHIVEALTRLRG